MEERPKVKVKDAREQWLCQEERIDRSMLSHEVSQELKAYNLALYSMGVGITHLAEVPGLPTYSTWRHVLRHARDAEVLYEMIQKLRGKHKALKRRTRLANELDKRPIPDQEVAGELAERIDALREHIAVNFLGQPPLVDRKAPKPKRAKPAAQAPAAETRAPSSPAREQPPATEAPRKRQNGSGRRRQRLANR